MSILINSFKDIGRICRENILSEKVVIVPSLKVGEDIRGLLVREEYDIINLKFKTIYNVAEESILDITIKENKRIISDTRAIFIMENELSKLRINNKLDYFSNIEINFEMAKVFYNLYKDLVLEGLDKETSKISRLDSDKLKSLDMIFKNYYEALNKNDLLDTASVYLLAKERGQFFENHSRICMYIEGTYFSKIERDIIELFSKEKYTYKIENQENRLNNIKDREIEFYAGKGESGEVSYIFRKIKECNIPFEEVSIYHTDNLVYPKIIREISEALNIDATFREGMPIGFCNEVKLLYSLFKWIKSDYKIKELIDMLDYVNIDSFNKDSDITIRKEEIKRALRKMPFLLGRENYKDGINIAMELIEKDRIRNEQDIDKSKEVLSKINRWIKGLLNLLPKEETTYREVVTSLMVIIEKYVVVVKDTVSFKSEIKEILDEYENVEGAFNFSTILENIEGTIRKKYIRKEGEAPGNIYVANYQNGFWSNRKYSFFVGLDSKKFPNGFVTNPLLLNSEIDMLRGLGITLRTAEELIEEESKNFTKVIGNREGRVYVSYSLFNLVEMKSISPSSMFLKLIRINKGDSNITYSNLKNIIGDPKGLIPLDIKLSLSKSEQWTKKVLNDGEVFTLESLGKIYPTSQEVVKCKLRKEDDMLTEYEGNIKENQVIIANNKEVVLSPSALEMFAKCPYKYFLSKIIKVRAIEELEVDYGKWLKPNEFGTLIHDIFKNYVEEVMKRKIASDKIACENVMDNCIKSVIEETRKKILPINEIVYSIREKEAREICKMFLEKENLTNISSSLEVPFGDSNNPEELCIGDRILYLSGTADRIDENEDNEFKIIDYKTGKSEDFKDASVKNGEHIQLIIYAMLQKNRLKEDQRVKEIEFYFTSISEKFKKKSFELKLMDDVIKCIEDIIEVSRQGLFVRNLNDDKMCKWCDYNKICNYERVPLREKEKFDILWYRWNSEKVRMKFYE